MKKVCYFLLAWTCLGCVSDSNVDPLAELTKRQMEDQTQAAELSISDDEFYALIQSIPSPIQSTALMQALGIEYSENILHTTDKAKEKSSWYSQSANLGIYGADMGYANLYGENKKSMDYLGTIRDLADKLKVGQFFDLAVIKELIAKKDDVDGLINASQINFQKMNDYLQQQKRGKVSVAMIMGGWIEGLYLSAKVANINPTSVELRENVAQQKLSLDAIDMLLKLYSKDEHFIDFKKDFDELVIAFAPVEILYHKGEIKKYEDSNGNLVVEDTSTSETVIKASDVVNIEKAVLKIRNKLINLK